ncbi:MAG: hypothetical protein QGG26_13415 [Candidatus Undinarchaeales archaeon]|jgi:hypothetical protein|nr:hypothetical protein [Candidatus Undinarchaeales archaeon]
MYSAADIDLESDGYAAANPSETAVTTCDLSGSRLTGYAIKAAIFVGGCYVLDAVTSLAGGYTNRIGQDPDQYLSPDGQARVAEALGTDEIWSEIEHDPSSYSGLDIVGRIHSRVMSQLEYDQSIASTGIDDALNSGKGICFDYSGMTYSAFLKLAADHPELNEQLAAVQWSFGVYGEEEMAHAWLQVRGDDGAWHHYETTADYVTGDMSEGDNVIDTPPLMEGYHTALGGKQTDAAGNVHSFVEWDKVIIPEISAGEQLVNTYEVLSGNDIPNELEAYLPQSHIIAGASLGAVHGTRLALKAGWDLVRGKHREKEKE